MLMGFLTLVNIQSRFLTNKNLSRDFRRIWKICSMCSDGPLSSTAIHLFRKAIERETGRVSKHRGYDGLVEDCKYLQKYRSPVEQRAAVCRIISSLFCAPVGIQLFRSLLGIMPVTWAYHLSAIFTQVFFQWLVGPCQAHAIHNETFKRGVFISKCRFLEESRCRGMCVNLCKIPTQQFFNNTLGFPFTMEPNYETGSCQITFGKSPLPLDQDIAVQIRCSGNCLPWHPEKTNSTASSQTHDCIKTSLL
ncbi:uncharacterized protein Gasu_37700 [Galdieria sulphuraria]|uniref:Beta-carotene isomerase D27-like C-terminal domain-containing protein n=1 Tax=Galdieria sulphuraria TaxID=130081 RepID=M2XYJ0_GALSU|nr:uncharacterized protein Gasu_37700 [Galdieria sulphuraria]EME28718.1 hypothetical protein Gasu_37700 [Galdieria sulphuraria]|eukprot:XP_005705238.1 hypothetical protein Gasu_37700 [Galdieria sulphuraria]